MCLQDRDGRQSIAQTGADHFHSGAHSMRTKRTGSGVYS